MNKYDIFCDYCGGVIEDGELDSFNHHTTSDGGTVCLSCHDKIVKDPVKARVFYDLNDPFLFKTQ